MSSIAFPFTPSTAAATLSAQAPGPNQPITAGPDGDKAVEEVVAAERLAKDQAGGQATGSQTKGGAKQRRK